MKAPKSVAVCTALFLLLTGAAIALADETLVDSLWKRYQLSRIRYRTRPFKGQSLEARRRASAPGGRRCAREAVSRDAGEPQVATISRP
jgi:hypothetical protein